MLAIFNHFDELFFLEFLALFSVGLHIVMDIDGSQLRWHVLVQYPIDKMLIVLRKRTLSIVLLLR